MRISIFLFYNGPFNVKRFIGDRRFKRRFHIFIPEYFANVFTVANRINRSLDVLKHSCQ